MHCTACVLGMRCSQVACDMLQIQLGPFSASGGPTSNKSKKDKRRGNSVAIVTAPINTKSIHGLGYAERVRKAFYDSKAQPENKKEVNLRPVETEAPKPKPSKSEKFVAKLNQNTKKG